MARMHRIQGVPGRIPSYWLDEDFGLMIAGGGDDGYAVFVHGVTDERLRPWLLSWVRPSYATFEAACAHLDAAMLTDTPDAQLRLRLPELHADGDGRLTTANGDIRFMRTGDCWGMAQPDDDASRVDPWMYEPVASMFEARLHAHYVQSARKQPLPVLN